jgi:hypothetical protein
MNLCLKIFLPLLTAMTCHVFPEANIGTLCVYEVTCYQKDRLVKIVLHDDSELSLFLKNTCYKNSRVIKKISSTPDFKKSTYFAFAGWPCKIADIVEKNDSIIVNYKEEYRNTDNNSGIAYSRPADVAIVYYIPFTEKVLVFSDVTNYGKSDTTSSE